jgi:hypothetical protein
MFRIAIVSSITFFASFAANAGQIQIGGASGLTSAMVNATGCTTACTQQGYVPVMFQGASVSSPGAPPTGTFFDSAGDGGSGVSFSKLNGQGSFWAIPTGGSTSSLVVPIGLLGVTDVWTMLNDIESTASRDVNVIFNFGTTATASTVAAVNVHLFNADGANANGQVRNALVCSTGCAETSQLGLTGEVTAGVTVVADNLWSQSFSCLSEKPTGVNSLAPAIGCSGTAYLDDQGFFFNSLSLPSLGAGLTNLNTYLVSVQVNEITNTTGGSGAGLSAITLDTAPTPEPSTVLLFVAGIGVVGLGRLRKRA